MSIAQSSSGYLLPQSSPAPHRRPWLAAVLLSALFCAALLALPAPAHAGSCTQQFTSKSDPTTGWRWSSIWNCGNRGGAAMYRTPSKSTQVAVMNSTSSWFVCFAVGDRHNGGNNIWYYSLGDSPAGVWGYMPAENVWTDIDPWPGIPACPAAATPPPSPPSSNLGRTQGDPVAIANADGRLEVFAIAAWDNSVWHISQTPTGGWSQWESLGGWADQLAASRNRDGRLELFVRGSDRAVHNRSQIAAGNSSWYPWGHLGGNVLAIAAAQNLDGRLEVFARSSDNTLRHIWQTPAGGWSAWENLGGWVDQIAVSRNNDGRLEVFVRGSDRAMHHRAQMTPGGGWYDWGHRGGSIDQIAVTQNAYGELETFTVGTDHAIWHNWQISPGNGTWSGWNSLGGWLDRIYASQLPDGRLEIFARGSDGALWHNWQLSISAGWSGWASEGGYINQPVVERNRDGRLEVFTRGPDGLVLHKWQQCVGCAWSAWAALPLLNPPPPRCWQDPPDWSGHKDGASGPQSDPINLIVCMQNGRTWDALFTELNKLPARTLVVDLLYSRTLSWERVFDPEDTPLFRDGKCISTVHADVQLGPERQFFAAREGGCDYDAITASYVNHFRAWRQAASGALFLSASIEDACLLEFTHCVRSFDLGRSELIGHLNQAAANAGWPLPDVSIVRALPSGSITQPNDHRAPYDGNVWILTFR